LFCFRHHGIAGVDMRETYKALSGFPIDSSFFLTGFPREQAKFGELYVDQVEDPYYYVNNNFNYT
jgi:hypothetical protein